MKLKMKKPVRFLAAIIVVFCAAIFLIVSFLVKGTSSRELEASNFQSETSSSTQNQSGTGSQPSSSAVSSGSTNAGDNAMNTENGTLSDNSRPESTKPENVNMVVYKGKITNIFFHPLIAFPEKAFDGGSYSTQMDSWFVTAEEFKRILSDMYGKGYVLIDIRDTFEEKEENGKKTLVRKDLMLPENKKPLVISVDDMNYYKYMKENGTVHKLILDANGNIATFTQFPGEEPIIGYDNEIVPILENFIKEHEDFSQNGARAIIGLTGYNGILGYNTHETASPDYENEKKQAVAVADKLKELGWVFASHGYHHYDSVKTSYDNIVSDTVSWKEEVASLVGPSEIYIYPYGSALKSTDNKFQYLQKAGFKVFYSVGSNSQYYLMSSYLLMDRYHIDGVCFKNNRDKPWELFDINNVIDNLRPWK